MKNSEQIAKAQRYCLEHKYKYTEPREKVLKAILASKDVLGAYDILEIMTTEDEKPKPPTIYRAIEFWEKHGFIHRVESANGYIACNHCAKHDNIDLLICDGCHDVVEIYLKPLTERLEKETKLQGFQPRIATTEIHGLCSKCVAKGINKAAG